MQNIKYNKKIFTRPLTTTVLNEFNKNKIALMYNSNDSVRNWCVLSARIDDRIDDDGTP